MYRAMLSIKIIINTVSSKQNNPNVPGKQMVARGWWMEQGLNFHLGITGRERGFFCLFCFQTVFIKSIAGGGKWGDWEHGE